MNEFCADVYEVCTGITVYREMASTFLIWKHYSQRTVYSQQGMGKQCLLSLRDGLVDVFCVDVYEMCTGITVCREVVSTFLIWKHYSQHVVYSRHSADKQCSVSSRDGFVYEF